MKIAFITASLEPGHDGVGDYSRRLAQACAAFGHEACLLSLNEPPPTSSIEGEELPALRLRSDMPWATRIKAARSFLEREQPGCISLQFVCYGYAPNGICLNLAQRLAALTCGFPVHIMFHELWIGHWEHATLKERIVGAAQRSCISAIVKRLRPEAIHTSISRYVELLAELGARAETLPLFGNIPIIENARCHWLIPELRRAGINVWPENRNEFFLAGMFGSLHPNWPPEPLLTQLSQIVNKRPVIISIGRIGPGGELWEQLSHTYSERISFVLLRERPAQHISQFLQAIDAGIGTTPFEVAGKSGTIAAMLEHGCPVLVNWHDQEFPVEVFDPRLHLLTPDFEFTKLRRQPAQPRLRTVAESFLKSLGAVPSLLGV